LAVALDVTCVVTPSLGSLSFGFPTLGTHVGVPKPRRLTPNSHVLTRPSIQRGVKLAVQLATKEGAPGLDLSDDLLFKCVQVRSSALLRCPACANPHPHRVSPHKHPWCSEPSTVCCATCGRRDGSEHLRARAEARTGTNKHIFLSAVALGCQAPRRWASVECATVDRALPRRVPRPAPWH